MAFMRLRRWVALGCAALGGTTAFATAVLPLNNDFESAEGYSLGPVSAGDGWTFSTSLTAAVVDDSFSGDQSLSLIGDGWFNFQADGFTPSFEHPVTWVDFYLKPVFAAKEFLPANIDQSLAAVTGFVKVDAVGEVYAVDGDGEGGGDWIASGFTTALLDQRAVNWLRISYRIDYGNKRWDMYLNGNLILADLGFLDNAASAFVQFRLKGDSENASFLDYLYVGSDNPLFTDTSGDGLPDSWLLAHGLDPATFQRYGDPDNDGVDNLTEFRLGLSPTVPDTDNDGVFDRRELSRGTNPKVAEVRALGNVPYSDGFEADALGVFTSGTRLWQVQAADNAVVEVAGTGGSPEGSHSLRLTGSGALVEREFSDAARAPIVWLDFHLKATAMAEPPEDIPADVAAVFYFGEDGQVMLLNGGGNGGGEWRSIGTTKAGWNRVTLRLNYTTQRWALWLNNVQVAADVGFARAVPYFSGFALKHSASESAGLDGFHVRHEEPALLDNDDDGLTNADEVTHGTNLDHWDTDGDGISDSVEIQIGLNPTVAETFVARLVDEGDGVLAWRTSFASSEGYAAGSLNGQLGWQSSGSAVNVAGYGVVSAQAGVTSIMERYLGASGLDQVWVTFRARLKAGPLPESNTLPGMAASLFGFRHEKTLSIYDSTQSKWVDRTVTASAGDWNNYALYLDYRTKRWLLVLNGTLIARDLPFRDGSVSTITRFRMLQASSADSQDPQEAFVDDLVVSNTEPAGFDFDADGLTNAQELALGLDPFKPDTDGDLIPDNWELANGLNPKVADALGDMDGDGFSNATEFQHATNPNEATTALEGYVHWDEWQGMTGSTVATLTGDARFPASPNHRGLLSSLEIPADRGINYGTRLRAWLTPTVSGPYTFWVAGDDSAELWLGTDETPFALKRIAYTTAYTGVREWEKYPATQRSATVTLEAGQNYYIQVLHKQATGGGNLSVAWQPPGGSRVVVPASALKAFPRFQNDQDEDALPDDWERANGLLVGSGGLAHSANGDFDQDGVLNSEEYLLGLRPNAPDTDTDGLSDGIEVDAGTSASNAADTGLPLAPWIMSSVGSPQQASGTIKSSTGSIWMMGNEGGPSSSGDTYRYQNQSVTGDFELVVAVKETDATAGSFGLILRDGFGNKAPTAYLELQKGGYYRFFARSLVNASLRQYGKINSLGLPPSSDGYWIRLRRQGNIVSAYYSGDGTRWTYFTGVNQVLPATCQLGFATWNAVATPTVREITNIRLRLDGDADGLYNDEEALLGTAIDDPDTDDDGLSDYEEVIDIGTNALGADVTSTEIGVHPGSSGVPVKGTWSLQSGTLKSETPLGSVDYAITLPTAGVYRVQLDVGCRINVTTELYFPFEFSVDGQFVQRVEIPIPVGESRSATVTLPWLATGAHHVRVFFDNTLTHRAISLNTLRVQAIGGTDADQNARPDWVDARLAGANRVFEPQPTSFVSPVCIEGVSRFQSMMTVKREGEVHPHLGSPGMGWYANIPLSATVPTRIETSFENGALITQSAVEWVPLNLLVDAATLSSGRLVVRKNDSIRVSSVPLDEVNQGGISAVQIVKAGATLVSQTLGTGAEDVIQYTFATAGVYTISTSYTSGAYSQAASVTVEVLDGQFAGNPLVGLNYAFTWKNALIGGGLVVETDNGLILDQATALSTGGQQFRVINQDLMPKSVVARAGQNGAVLARAELTALRVSTDSETSSEVVEVYSNGTKLIQTPIILSQLPEGIKVVVEIFVGGVTFEDGTVKKTFYAADFDEIGRNYLRFVYPAGLSSSYCHRTHVYVGTVYLGTL